MAKKESKFNVEGVELCGSCHGTGIVLDGFIEYKECPVCEGSGRIYKTRKGTVTVEPYKGQLT